MKGFETETNGAVTKSKAPATAARHRLTKQLPTDRIIKPKQFGILRGYAIQSGIEKKPVTNEDVAKIVELAATTVAMTNAFFVDVGFLTKTDKGFLPAPEVIEFNRACSLNPETAARKLAPLLRASWFAKKLLPTLELRPLPVSEAIELLADESSAIAQHKPQLEIVIEYLDAAGLLYRVGDVLKSSHFTPPKQDEPTTIPPADIRNNSGGENGNNRQKGEGVNFSIDVQINTQELATWSPDRIAAMFAGMAQVLAAKNPPRKTD
jgi:hypothetical protein